MPMAQSGSILLFILVVLLVIFFFRRWRLMDVFMEEINNFRGGPPAPMHPSPADDGVLLRRLSRKSEN